MELLIRIAIILNIIPKPDYFGGYINNFSTPRFSALLYSLSLISFKLLKETRFFAANRKWSAMIKGTGIVISKMTGKHGKDMLLFLYRFLFVMHSSLSRSPYRFIRICKMSCLQIPRCVCVCAEVGGGGGGGRREEVYFMSDFIICSQGRPVTLNTN